MADTAATAKRVDEDAVFRGLTEAEKKFLLDLGVFLTKYPKFGGQTPYEEALAGSLQVQVSILRPVPERRRVAEFTCRNICYYDGRPYCC
jgi:hypothetical protein